jgi:hypothetical protein
MCRTDKSLTAQYLSNFKFTFHSQKLADIVSSQLTTECYVCANKNIKEQWQPTDNAASCAIASDNKYVLIIQTQSHIILLHSWGSTMKIKDNNEVSMFDMHCM